MNKPEEAVHWLTVAADEGYPCYPLFENDPNLNNIRNDARFAQLMTNLRRRWNNSRQSCDRAGMDLGFGIWDLGVRS